MKTFAQFKSELGVATIKFSTSTKTGRSFAEIGTKNIIIGKNTNVTKPLFVVESVVTEDGVVRPKPLYILCNSGVTAGPEL